MSNNRSPNALISVILYLGNPDNYLKQDINKPNRHVLYAVTGEYGVVSINNYV